jgi:hypothetical protein
MVESVLFFTLGFLVANLFGLLILPHVYARAERLAARRIEADIPVSLAEIRADRDLLRAEFAVSVCCFETSIEHLKARMTGQMAELGRKTDEINRLKLALEEKAKFAPAARQGARGDERPPSDDELAIMMAPHKPERSLIASLADLARLNPDLEKSRLVPRLDEMALCEADEQRPRIGRTAEFANRK